MKRRLLALSIRQPHAEQILRGKKSIEYRSKPTNKRERVYIYAAMRPAPPKYWREIGLKLGSLPTGVLVGTIEIVDCYRKGPENYHWRLAKPVRLKRALKPKNHPQPAWFNPF
ncbi:MAG TPA: ASCH domain-containing protein [Pyrinomonadaceae bacterium]|nr:ASCH domain-containing protein [Pyrinomonadaceae bacterium]